VPIVIVAGDPAAVTIIAMAVIVTPMMDDDGAGVGRGGRQASEANHGTKNEEEETFHQRTSS
jgi:hypothetical protein